MKFARSRLTLRVAILGMSLELSSIASGIDDKHSRAAVDVQEVKRVRQNPKSDGEDGPRITQAEVYAMSVEKKLIDGIDTTIKYLEKTAPKFKKGSRERLDILERLLNLYREQALYVRNQEFREYDRQWRQWDATGRKGREPQLATRKSQGLWVNVAESARRMMVEYPRAKNADATLHTQGLATQLVGKEKEAARIYTQVIQKYPNSNKAGEAYYALGDFYFDRNDYRNAMNNYKQGLRFKQSQLFGWSLYKLGWCHYNLANFKGALKSWQDLVSLARSNETKQNLQLRDEAMREMILAFAELKDIEGAIGYYRANGGSEFIAPLLTKLADALAYNGRYGEAIKALKRLLQIDPYSEKAPEAQKEIVSLAAEMNKQDLLWQELERLGSTYGLKSAWAEQNAKNRELVLETQEMARTQVLYYSKLMHKKAQTGNNKSSYLSARQGYTLYLRNYPGARETNEVKYNLADVEYWLADYRRAGQLYLELASLGPQNAVLELEGGKTKNVHREVSRDMVRSYNEEFKPEIKGLLKKKPDFSRPPEKMSVAARNFIKACGLYTRWYPDDKAYNKDCDVLVTEAYYRTGNKKEAMGALWLVAKKYSSGKEGPDAVDRLIPLYKDDKKELLVTVDKLLEIPAYQSGEIGKKLRDLKRGGELEAIASEKDPLQRAKRYAASARANSKAPDADKLWYNSAVDYLKAGAVPEAQDSYLMIVNQYPKSGQARESLLQVAKLYKKRLDFARASQLFAQYAQKYPKEKDANGALAEACNLQIAMDSERAYTVCQSFIRANPGLAQAFVEKLIISAFRRKDQARLVQLVREEYLPKFKLSPELRIVALHRVVAALGAQDPRAMDARKQILSAFRQSQGRVSGEALRYVGELVFRDADSHLRSYLSMKLVGGSVDKLAGSIEKKGAALAKVKAGYDQVLATKDSYWGVAALHQVGVAYYDFAQLLDSPPGITGAKVEDVQKQLAPQAQQVRTEAVKAFDAAHETIEKYQVYNEWSPRVLATRNKIAGKSREFDDWVVTPDFVAASMARHVSEDVVRE